MNKTAYMTELTQRLRHLPLSREDVEDALRFCDEYFDEAGPEQEQAVIAELGSPAYVAAQIALKLSASPTPLTERASGDWPDGSMDNRCNYRTDGKSDGRSDDCTNDRAGLGFGSGSDSGFGSDSNSNSNSNLSSGSGSGSGSKPGFIPVSESSSKPGLKRDASVLRIVILGILAAPVALPLAIAGLSVIFALTISAAAIVLAFGVGGFACMAAGAAIGISAVTQLSGDFVTGVYFIGVALFSIGMGGLLAKLGFWIGRCFVKLATKIGARFFGRRHRRSAGSASKSVVASAPNAAVGFATNAAAGFTPNAAAGFTPNTAAGFTPNASVASAPNTALETGVGNNAL